MRLAVVAALLLAAAPAFANDEVGVGLPAPAFSLKTLNPEASGTDWVALDKYVGEEPEDAGAKAVLLTFFASWCEPCKKEMPFLVQLDQLYRVQGLRVLGVCIDKEDAGVEAAKKLVAEKKVAYPVLADRWNFLARRYLGEQAPLPSVFLIKKDGVVVRIERGYKQDASAFLLAEVQDVLGVQRTAAKRAAEPAAAPKPGAQKPAKATAAK
jgi:thiol-disulfide isomerase/thioredoxin